VPEPFTLYREIRALPAGHTQWIDAEGPREPKPYINLAAVLAEGARDPAPAGEMPERLRAAALDSVRAHMLADVEVGTFLSGGVDSGSLLGLMRDAGQHDVRAITLAFEQFRGTAEDEAPLAARVAEHYHAKHIVRAVTEQEFVDDLPAILEAMDQPSIDGVNTWFVSKVAREAGLKVAISGLGGDELLAGYPSFTEMPRWRRRYGLFAALPGLGVLARKLMAAALPGQAKAHPKLLGLLEYADSWPGLYLLRRGLFLPHELPKIMDGEVAREGMRRLRPLDSIADSMSPDPGSPVAKVCALESANYMRNQLLRDADWAGMAHSLEIRVPLVDATLLKNFAPSVGGLTPGDGKAALANAPSLSMPDEVVKRAKTGFYVPTQSWMGAAAGLRLPAREAREPKGLVSRRWSQVVLRALGAPTQALAS
jgi:asparagine synthase (glutamine-hydrolysing)